MTASLLFFGFFAAVAVPGRFFSLFYQAHDLNAAQIGLLLSLSSFTSMPSTALLCNLADRLAYKNARAHVLFASHSLSILFFQLHALALPGSAPLLPSLTTAPLRIPYLCIVAALHGAFRAPGFALVSALSLSRLRNLYGTGGHVRFGTVRLWGAVSWALVAVPQGALMDYAGATVAIQYVGYTLFSLFFLAAVASFDDGSAASPATFQGTARGLDHCATETDVLLPEPDSGHPPAAPSAPELDDHPTTNALTQQQQQEQWQQTPSHAQPTAAATLRAIVCCDGARSILFFHMFFWQAVGMSQVENLLFLFFANDLRASNLLCGLSVVVTVLFEIPMFGYAPALLRRFGAHSLAVLGAAAYVVRVFGYTLVPSAWAVLPLETLHGVTVAAVQTASVAFVAERTPPELEASAQAGLDVLGKIAFTLGAGGGGYVLHRYGATVMYRGTGLIVACATLAFAIACALSRDSESNRPTVNEEVKSACT